MKIALVRHAQTEENFLQKLQGRKNNLLNETGIRQAHELRKKIKDKIFDICYTSPLTRCVETAKILVGDRVEMIEDERLIERDMGDLDDHPREEYNAYMFWDYDLNYDNFHVEPIQDIFNRCKDFLNEIKEKHPDQSVLIVTHGAPYRALRYLIHGKKLQGKLLDGYIDNCQYEEYEIN